MNNIVTGYKWKNLPGVSPSIVEAASVTGKIPQVLARGSRPLWILDYEFADYGKYRVKSVSAQWKERKSQTAHLYPPNTLYWEDTRHVSGRRSSSWVIFTGGSLTGINSLVKEKKYACFLDPEGKLGQTIRRCTGIGEHYGERGYWQAQSILCEALYLLINSKHIAGVTYTIGEPDVPAKTLLSDEADAFLKEHIAERIKLEDIAESLHVSISSLSHRYKQEKGVSPITRLLSLRINYSKALLLKGYPLKAIAVQLGFTDAFHFSKTFKIMEGIPPREFLKRTDRMLR